jgi:hypothetical protein
MRAFALCRADLLLAGTCTPVRPSAAPGAYYIPGYSALVVQAGTATSTRTR